VNAFEIAQLPEIRLPFAVRGDLDRKGGIERGFGGPSRSFADPPILCVEVIILRGRSSGYRRKPVFRRWTTRKRAGVVFTTLTGAARPDDRFVVRLNHAETPGAKTSEMLWSFHHMEDAMELKDQTDHIALLSLMITGVLTKRLVETGQLDQQTAEHVHRLVQGVRIHSTNAGLTDLNVLFDNIDAVLVARRTEA
jgi:hypothetical protein